MMRLRTKFLLLCFLCNILTYCNAIGISSKLDFDSSKSSPKLIESVNKFKQVLDTHPKNDQINAKSDNVGVICVSAEGCNVTQTKNKDTIETDVVVHVKTNVGINNKSTTKDLEDEIPDIPIIIGTSTHNSNENGIIVDDFEDKPKFLPEIEPFVPVLEDLKPEITRRIDLAPDSYRIPLRNNFKPVNVPLFDGSYHRHTFGENPPPVVWYPKNEFKPTPAAWNPTTEKYHLGSGVTCTCKNEVPTGLQWYPRARSVGTRHHIDDKLAPLL